MDCFASGRTDLARGKGSRATVDFTFPPSGLTTLKNANSISLLEGLGTHGKAHMELHVCTYECGIVVHAWHVVHGSNSLGSQESGR